MSHDFKITEAIILAGGLGTRLRTVVSDVPKPLAPVAGAPFLDWVLSDLANKGIIRVILATGYGSEAIEKRYSTPYAGLEIIISREIEPLGTGGAIRLACSHVTQPHVVVLNGDSYSSWDPTALLAQHYDKRCPISIVLQPMKSPDRYGTVHLKDGYITQFHEKKVIAEGLINSGIYLLSPKEMSWPPNPTFSLEKHVLEPASTQSLVAGLIQEGPFIDIGIPASFVEAQSLIPQWLAQLAPPHPVKNRTNIITT
jgi:D-glycero-alpha-D-manno-heptose 1-phosphate guanylyltransferase